MEFVTKTIALIAILAVAGLVLVAWQRSAPLQQNTLSVSGTHESLVAPDQAQLTIQVQTRGETAAAVSAQNRELLTKVMAALNAQGVSGADIETAGLVLDRWQDWDVKNQVNVDKGYQQVTTLTVTINDLTKVGSVVDSAIAAGANSVQDISFTLRPETEARVKEQALQEATKAATKKARLLADAAGTKIGTVTMMSESSDYRPWISNTKAITLSDSTPISQKKVSVTATVQMSYELA